MKSKTMKSISIFLFLALVGGCSSAAIKAWNTSKLDKLVGTKDPTFILEHDAFVLKSTKFSIEDFGDVYADRICQSFNEDKQLNLLSQTGIIGERPKCHRSPSEGVDLVIDVGSPKEQHECFFGFGCTDRYIRYESLGGSVHVYSEMNNLPYMEGVEYSVGHIKNMIILANIKKNKDNPEWMAKMKKVCRDFKDLRSTCG